MKLLSLYRWCSIVCYPLYVCTFVLYTAITTKCAYHFRDVVSKMLCDVDPFGVLLQSKGQMVRRRYGLKVCCYLVCIWRLSLKTF